MRRLGAALIACLFLGSPAQADPLPHWGEYRDSEDMDWLGTSDWKRFADNYQMDIGMVSRASYYIAWRDGNEVGVLLQYKYASPVSPAELPAPGPLDIEVVEATIACSASTVRLHQIYLYAPDGHMFGKWFDPSAEANPSSFGSSSLIGMAASRVC